MYLELCRTAISGVVVEPGALGSASAGSSVLTTGGTASGVAGTAGGPPRDVITVDFETLKCSRCLPVFGKFMMPSRLSLTPVLVVVSTEREIVYSA
jgi:hypothetical protein